MPAVSAWSAEPTRAPRQLPGASTCDVAIVGYGPVGMTCGALLAQLGLDVVIVERFPTRFGLPRAGHLDGETMRTFQRLGIADAVELIASPMLLWELVTAEREVLASIKLGEGGSGWKEDYLCYQPELEAIIDARARQLGVRVFMGVAAQRIDQDEQRVRVTGRPTEDARARPCIIDAAYVIGADGAGSFVRSAVGVERRDLGFSAMDHLVVDFEHNDPDRDLPQLPEVYQVLDVKRPSLAGRWNGGRWSRWEFAARDGESKEYLESDATVWNLLAEWGITQQDGTIKRRAVYSFESSLADTWRVGRVLLMGDAAHTMPPFMGQGMLSGIRDAVNLSWKLAAVLAGEAYDRLLDTYQAERAPHVNDIIHMSIALGETVLITDPEQARLRDELLRSGRGPRPPLFPRLTAGIVRPTDHPQAIDAAEADGRPARQARVALDGHVDRLDNHFPRPGWRIVSRHALPADLLGPRQQELLRALDFQVAHVTRGAVPGSFLDIDGEYDLWFRQTGRKAFVERPDNYIFGTVRRIEELPQLLDELADALAAHGWRGIAAAEPST